MTKAKDGRKGNKNAKKWSFDDEIRLHHMVEQRRADGISDRKAVKAIARDRQLHSLLPDAAGPHRVVDSEQKRVARYLKRLQWPLRGLARAAMPHMTITDCEKVGAEIEAAQQAKDGFPSVKS